VGFWHRMKVRLGLEDEWDDEYYDDDYAEDGDDPGTHADYASPYGSGAHANAVKRVDRGPDLDRARSAPSLRSVPAGPATVTPVTPQVKMHIVEPKTFAEAQSIADKFKQGTPVILNLTMAKPDLAKRLLDFAAGLSYGLDGGLQKVSDKVFMLSPHNVEVSDVDRRRLQSTGMFTAGE